MSDKIWQAISEISVLPRVSEESKEAFNRYHTSQRTYTRSEGNLAHSCVFFLPYDKQTKMVYLGDHIKAKAWIPPGGHIELGESPAETAIREMQEELGVRISADMLEPFDLSHIAVKRAHDGCTHHYDIWYLAHIKRQEFTFDRGEYLSAEWLGIEEAISRTSVPQFSAVIGKLL